MRRRRARASGRTPFPARGCAAERRPRVEPSGSPNLRQRRGLPQAEWRPSGKWSRDEQRLRQPQRRPPRLGRVAGPSLVQLRRIAGPEHAPLLENRSVQAHLYKTGQIDAAGRVIDMSKNASKFAIIEQEFKAAEKLEYWRKKEEAEMRHRVQMKRHEALARARRAEKMAKAKEDRRIRAEIVRCAKGITSGDMSASVSAPRSSFITEGVFWID